MGTMVSFIALKITSLMVTSVKRESLANAVTSVAYSTFRAFVSAITDMKCNSSREQLCRSQSSTTENLYAFTGGTESFGPGLKKKMLTISTNRVQEAYYTDAVEGCKFY